MSAPNLLKCSLILFGMLQLASTATFRCYFTFDDYVDIPIDNPGGLVNSSRPCLDINKPTCFVAIGYDFKLDGPLLKTVIPTLLSLGDKNIVLVNWVEEASNNNILGDAVSYPTNALPNSKKIGILVGNGAVELVQIYHLRNKLYFLGHSLGAHLGGYAGRQSRSKGVIFVELVGLDPARPGYEKSLLNPYESVGKTSAANVVIVHCDIGGYGINETLGHSDFWFNYGNYVSKTSSRLQPGCSRGTSAQEIFTGGSRESHDYCYKVYNASLTNPTIFEAGKATNWFEFVRANGVFNETNYLGPLVDPTKTGDFYLVSSATYPYGYGSGGLTP